MRSDLAAKIWLLTRTAMVIAVAVLFGISGAVYGEPSSVEAVLENLANALQHDTSLTPETRAPFGDLAEALQVERSGGTDTSTGSSNGNADTPAGG